LEKNKSCVAAVGSPEYDWLSTAANHVWLLSSQSCVAAVDTEYTMYREITKH